MEENKSCWKVTQRMHIAFIVMGLAGFMMLGSYFEITNNVSFGVMLSGIWALMGYKWEYIE